MSTISASTTSTTAYKVTADTTGVLTLQTGASPTTAVTIDSSQNVGIGTASPSERLHVYGANPYILLQGSEASAQTLYMRESAGSLFFGQYAVGTRMTLDSSGNLGLGVTPSAWTSVAGKSLQIFSAGNSLWANGTGGLTTSVNATYDSGWKYTNTSGSAARFDCGNGNGTFSWGLASGTGKTAGDALTWSTVMTLDASGNLLIGDSTVTTVRLFAKSAASGTAFLLRGSSDQRLLQVVDGTTSSSPSGTSAVAYLERNSASSRSLNASGTLNASGADYAEYMTKAGNFTAAKGDVVGINADGKLTNVFADAVSFVVKSTDPSYVGGDVWGNEEALGMTRPEHPARVPDEAEQRLVSEATDETEAVYETVVINAGDTDEEWAAKEAEYETNKEAFDTALEAARQTVDRIAFAGQVPVNVTGATAGQYIVPVNDNGSIKGEAVSNPTFEQYQQAVGKVIAIEQDGRARIIVKVA